MSAFEGTGALVLAAGRSLRFQGDKLLHPLQGKPLAAHIADTLAALPFSCRIAVCPADNSERRALFASRGFEVIENTAPGEGMGSSLALGAAAAELNGIQTLMVFLADMPFISAEHILALLATHEDGNISASETDGVPHPPAAFPRSQFEILKSLQGDSGAKHLLRGALDVRCPPGMAKDFDTPADFASFEAQEPVQRVGSSRALG